MTTFKQTLKTHLVTELGLDASDLHDDTELFSSGLIDSLRVLELVGFVERHSGLRLPTSAISLDNFDSIERMAGLVASVTHDRKAS